MPLFLTRLLACSPILMGVVHLHVSSSCYYFFKCGRFALIQLGAEQQQKKLGAERAAAWASLFCQTSDLLAEESAE